ncbi:hypothetical protein [Rhodomicrobium lacus]|uniref:hypothetical protein n=1 Tax=Rhodomicrobium lacus TaxID=2498452 RepID=UPI000F8E6952|nr:hypothetical protein [Rhodomicrobium lacus]
MRPIAALLIALALTTPAAAHPHHRRPAPPPPGPECREPIRAAGDAYHLIRSAQRSAVKRWQEQVINAHGERFMTWELARVVDVHCDPARVGGSNTLLDLKRCVVVARPCKND